MFDEKKVPPSFSITESIVYSSKDDSDENKAESGVVCSTLIGTPHSFFLFEQFQSE